MPNRRVRRAVSRVNWLVVAMVAIASSSATAADVKMRDGFVYKNATVIHRDAARIELQVPFGKVALPLQSVESIDGVRIGVVATPTAVTPVPSVSPVPVAMPSSSALPSPSPAEVVPAVSPVPSLVATPNPEPSPATTWPEYRHSWNMEGVLLLFVALSALWMGTVSRVQRDHFARRADPRFWSALTIALPGIGYAIYRLACGVQTVRAKRALARSPNENIAVRERDRVKTATRARRGFEFLDEDRQAVLLRKDGDQSGIENAQELLEEALLARASDVHIEPAESEYRVRFRVDGLMQEKIKFDRSDGQRVVSALKTLAQIDVAEKRKAQDGRFRVRTGESDVDFRVATANSIFGEKVVIRVLDRKAGLLGLGDLGMSRTMFEKFDSVLHSRSGMILATGPTGSGKTSTIYAALSQIDATKLNVMTIEDPVEYELDGATQIPLNPRAGITFESGLRSLLRQDPDVIFVGEMRDLEAAQIALRAALTGHLVFSSLHTKDAVGTIVRLEEMRIERNLLASALLVVLAQRLVRVLCPDCREPYPCATIELLEIGIGLPEGETVFRAAGCEKCGHTGYVGRTGIFEMIVFDDEMRQALNDGAGEKELTALARTKGFCGYREDGAEKILLGITSVEEVLQAT